jgi:hypothetical protein
MCRAIAVDLTEVELKDEDELVIFASATGLVDPGKTPNCTRARLVFTRSPVRQGSHIQNFILNAAYFEEPMSDAISAFVLRYF